jgi:hypothetical protein
MFFAKWFVNIYLTRRRALSYQYISFNPLRSVGIPSVKYIKPENMFKHIGELQQTECILFPEYWQVNSLVYVQEYLEIDRDLRVVVIGDQVVSSYWQIRPPGCFHNNIARGGKVDCENEPKSVVEDIKSRDLVNEILRAKVKSGETIF